MPGAQPRTGGTDFIHEFLNDKDSIDRERVFRQLLEEKGIAVNEGFMLTGIYISINAYNQPNELPASGQGVDAVVAANDDMAVAALQALQNHGYSVPGDVIVSGYDDRPAARESTPPLTAVAQPRHEQALAAVSTLLSLMDRSPHSDEVHPPHYFSGSFRLRSSARMEPPQTADLDLPFAGTFEEAIDTFFDRFMANYPGTDGKENLWNHCEVLARLRKELTGRTFSPDTFLPGVSGNREDEALDLAWW